MNNLTQLIASYLVKPKMKLLNWIILDNIYWNNIAQSPNAMYMKNYFIQTIYKYCNWTFWISLAANLNPETLYFLEQNIDKINWNILSKNPSAIHILHLWRFKTPIFILYKF